MLVAEIGLKNRRLQSEAYSNSKTCMLHTMFTICRQVQSQKHVSQPFRSFPRLNGRIYKNVAGAQCTVMSCLGRQWSAMLSAVTCSSCKTTATNNQPNFLPYREYAKLTQFKIMTLTRSTLAELNSHSFLRQFVSNYFISFDLIFEPLDSYFGHMKQVQGWLLSYNAKDW